MVSWCLCFKLMVLSVCNALPPFSGYLISHYPSKHNLKRTPSESLTCPPFPQANWMPISLPFYQSVPLLDSNKLTYISDLLSLVFSNCLPAPRKSQGQQPSRCHALRLNMDVYGPLSTFPFGAFSYSLSHRWCWSHAPRNSGGPQSWALVEGRWPSEQNAAIGHCSFSLTG